MFEWQLIMTFFNLLVENKQKCKDTNSTSLPSRLGFLPALKAEPQESGAGQLVAARGPCTCERREEDPAQWKLVCFCSQLGSRANLKAPSVSNYESTQTQCCL